MGQRLTVIRRALDLSQEELASKIGVAAAALSAWEVGRNQIDVVKLAKAARRYGFSTDWVTLGDISTLRRDLADKVEAIVRLGVTRGPGRPRSAVAAPGSAKRPANGPKGPEPPDPTRRVGSKENRGVDKDCGVVRLPQRARGRT